MVKGARQSRTGFRGFGPPAAGWFRGFKRVVVAPWGADFKEKDTAAAAGCVEWLCSIRSREKVLEMNPRWPDGAYVEKLLPFSSAVPLFCLMN